MNEENFDVVCKNFEKITELQQINTPSDFYTVFPDKLTLEDEYAVSLTQICFRKTWKNIYTTEIIEFETESPYKKQPPAFVLEPAYYENISDLINKLNKYFIHISSQYSFILPTIFHLNEKTGRIILSLGLNKFGNESILPIMSQNLCKILGFIDKDNKPLRFYNIASFGPVIKNNWIEFIEAQGMPLIYDFSQLDVYTNIIEPNLVGNHQLTLLSKIYVSPNTKYNEDVCIKPTAKYFKVAQRDIPYILIQICDPNGRLVKFDEREKVSAVLNFRKIW